MPINLRPVTKENWRELAALRGISKQEGLVIPNLRSIALCQFKDEKIPFGIYHDDVSGGFVVIDLGDYDISDFMIDYRYKGKGYERIALVKIIQLFRILGQLPEAVTRVIPANIEVKNLYESVGFRETGEMSGKEIIMRMQL